MALFPDANERSYLVFLIGKGHFGLRYLIAAALFVLGFWLSLAGACLPLGLGLILIGHLPLWVKRQKLAPAPVDPLEDPVWAPSDPDWHAQIEERLAAGKKWDQSFWDITSPLAIITLLLLGLVGFFVFAFGVAIFDGMAWLPFTLAAICLWAPLFINGTKAPWHPNQLMIKARALAPVTGLVNESHPERYDVVPLLGLMEGARGQYPVDARVMLRPKAGGDEGFLGVQVQCTLNSVQGKNYPYVYCVVLAKPGYPLKEPSRAPAKVVIEPGSGDDVHYLVVRQYADRRGGWHTPEASVALLLSTALDIAERSRLARG